MSSVMIMNTDNTARLSFKKRRINYLLIKQKGERFSLYLKFFCLFIIGVLFTEVDQLNLVNNVKWINDKLISVSSTKVCFTSPP